MQIRQLNKKLYLVECTNQEKMAIRRTCVNVSTQGSALVLEDNLFNRIYLGYKPEEFYRDRISTDAPEMNPALRDYQVRDIQSMLNLTCVLNRNMPGYGKTLEAIEYCRLRGLKRILVICPKSVVLQWKTQFEQWWPDAPHVETNPESAGLGLERVVFITNYDKLTPRNIAPKGSRKKILQPSQLWLKCKQRVWDIVILDESHRIKRASAQRSIAVKELPCIHRMCLTGTPILGHPDDLWSQLQFLDPRWSGSSYWAFTERFCECEEDNWGKKPVGLTPSTGAQDLLAKVLATISVGGDNYKVTAGKNIIPITLQMTPEQRNLYKDIVNLSLDRLEEVGITVKNAMDQIIKQQQVTTNCTMFSPCKKNPKFEWVKDWLEDNEDEKLVIFTKFAEVAKSLHKIIPDSVIYIGEMSEKDRLKAKSQFVQPSGGARVIIGTIGALSEGVDGLQNVCKNACFLDRDWTPGINDQAESRIDRSGQPGMSNIWILNMEKSIDEYVEQIQDKKAEDIKEVFARVRDCVRSWE